MIKKSENFNEFKIIQERLFFIENIYGTMLISIECGQRFKRSLRGWDNGDSASKGYH